jgi:probable addiction module antidote protein
METEAIMSKLVGVVSHHEREVEELREDREFGVAYLQAALESLDNPEERGGGLLALRAVAEAYGGLGAVAAEAGISRESLYRSLSPKGNPTLKTLIAVLKTLGLRLSVTTEDSAKRSNQSGEQTENESAAKADGDSVAA